MPRVHPALTEDEGRPFGIYLGDIDRQRRDSCGPDDLEEPSWYAEGVSDEDPPTDWAYEGDDEYEGESDDGENDANEEDDWRLESPNKDVCGKKRRRSPDDREDDTRRPSQILRTH